MLFDDVRTTLRERIERGATLDELETIVFMTRGLRADERDALWLYAWAYDPRKGDAEERSALARLDAETVP